MPPRSSDLKELTSANYKGNAAQVRSDQKAGRQAGKPTARQRLMCRPCPRFAVHPALNFPLTSFFLGRSWLVCPQLFLLHSK